MSARNKELVSWLPGWLVKIVKKEKYKAQN